MASLTQKLRTFLAGPQGQKMIAQGRRQLAKPENQQKLRNPTVRRHDDGNPSSVRC
jgi:hypothetical protein